LPHWSTKSGKKCRDRRYHRAVTEPSPDEVPETPDPPTTPEPGPVARKGPPWPAILYGLAGLAVGALAVGGAWLASGSGGQDSRPIAAPDKVGGLVPYDKVEVNQKPMAKPVVDRTLKAMQESARRLSESHGGAGALYAQYADNKFEKQIVVMAYRDRSADPLFVPYVNPDDLGLAKPQQTVERYGSVSCLVINQATRQGETPPPGSARAASCSRSSGSLTVQINPSGDMGDPAEVAKLVDEVWASVS
jgi:hypothetical protein